MEYTVDVARLATVIAEGAASCGRGLNPFDFEQPDVRQMCVQRRNSLCGLRGIELVKHPTPRDRGRWSRPMEPLWVPTLPPTQPVSGILPT